MGREINLKNDIVQSILVHAREHSSAEIDKAYEYFWDGHHPEEFMTGTALSLGFMNFEDWFVFDYKFNEAKETLLDIHLRDNRCHSEEETEVIKKIKDSIISLYEVSSVSKDKRAALKDLVFGGESDLRDKKLIQGLKKGDLFATRLLELDGKTVISGCVYPFKPDQKKKVLANLDKQFGRYKKNANPDGTMREFLKDFGDLFNIFWMNLILGEHKEEDQSC